MEFVLKGIFDYAVSNGWIGENPVDRVTVPKIASDDDDMVFLSVCVLSSCYRPVWREFSFRKSGRF
ncbi:hypothetical protein [Bifidobacterium bifidum]|uniref:hypothetical protein n=1 Tax=Bifidobacterium bifidum TaxID=1681 RepID=UPI001E30A75A|nr:hypothetical protein [Bifidobacterium bifidum]MDB1254029.1 hypothetical protein [Bifidobacterium bifidum]MDB1255729.1 hypothetical protein [Bifidobacterium bifidum]MDB1259182.1 hypothetical protein [Bifidobacterium bifidum]